MLGNLNWYSMTPLESICNRVSCHRTRQLRLAISNYNVQGASELTVLLPGWVPCSCWEPPLEVITVTKSKTTTPHLANINWKWNSQVGRDWGGNKITEDVSSTFFCKDTESKTHLSSGFQSLVSWIQGRSPPLGWGQQLGPDHCGRGARSSDWDKTSWSDHRHRDQVAPPKGKLIHRSNRLSHTEGFCRQLSQNRTVAALISKPRIPRTCPHRPFCLEKKISIL